MIPFSETLNQWSVLWFEYIAICVIDSAIAFSLIGLLWLGMRKRVSAQFGYFLFLLVFLKFLIPAPFSLPDILSGIQFNPISGSPGEAYQIDWMLLGESSVTKDNPNALNTKITSPQLPTDQQKVASPSAILMLVWLFFVALFFIRFLGQTKNSRKLIKSAHSIDLRTYPIDLEQLASTAGLQRKVHWVSDHWINTPLVYGIMRPIIALPSDFHEQYTPSQMKWILFHELTHIKRNDLAVSLLQKLIQILFFFYPLVWWLNSIVDRLREFSCDDSALKGIQITRTDCSVGFLNVVAQANQLCLTSSASLGMNNYKSMIRSRLMRILDSTHLPNAKLSWFARGCIVLLALVIGAFTVQHSIAQSMQWQQVTSQGDSPPQLQGYAMCYDENRQKTVLFGGFEAGPRIMHNETWEWDGSQWEQVNIDISERPAERFLTEMVYDPNRNKIVLYGGADVVTYETFEDTWEYDGTTWTQIDTEGPGIKWGHTMAYDPVREKVLLFGGNKSTSYNGSSELWEYDDSEWSQIHLENPPPPRALARMVLDEKRQKIVLFGGDVNDSHEYGDTWEWDGEKFTKVSDSGPSPRYFFGMAYDPDREKVILFGGSNHDTYLGETWEWNGNEWKQLNITEPSPKAMIDLSYDKIRKKIVLYGGNGLNEFGEYTRFNDTWELSFTSSGISNNLWPQYSN